MSFRVNDPNAFDMKQFGDAFAKENFDAVNLVSQPKPAAASSQKS